MEFKYRAGEDRPSPFLPNSSVDGYFAAQALRAGYMGSDLRRPDPMQPHMLPAREPYMLPLREPLVLPLREPHMLPIRDPHMLPPREHPMLPAREALRRELEKERIREEIIAREILRKRELEEEVRRELAYEREITLRRQADRYSLAGSGGAAGAAALHAEPQRLLLPPPPPALAHGPVPDRFSDGFVERMPPLGRHNIGVFERLPVRQLSESRETRQVSEIDKGRVVYLGSSTSSPSLVGSKRKAAAEITELSSSKKVQKEWFCSLCQVSATSEQALNEHHLGKKHKNKEEELRKNELDKEDKNVSFQSEQKDENCVVVKKVTAFLASTNVQPQLQVGNNYVTSQSEKNDGKSGVINVGAASSQQQQLQVGQFEQPRVKDIQQQPKVGQSNKQDVLKKGVKRPFPRCELCNVKCNSELMLASHLGGKKHLARIEELEGSKGTSVYPTGSRVNRKVDSKIIKGNFLGKAYRRKPVKLFNNKKAYPNKWKKQVMESEATEGVLSTDEVGETTGDPLDETGTAETSQEKEAKNEQDGTTM